MRAINLLFISLLIFSLQINAHDLFGVKQLTFESAHEGFPTWSPDGKSIIYQYVFMGDTTWKNGLWKISVDGKAKQQIFRGISEHPKCSPDGNYIVFDSDYGNSIKIISSGGGEAFSFLADSIKINQGGLPCWSPDASKIAFKDSENFLCIYDIKLNKTTRIFNKEGLLLIPACWSNDGQFILFSLMDKATRKSTIWKISPEGKDLKQIMGHHENFYRYIDLSPDGTLLMYGVYENRRSGIYIMSIDGGKSLPLSVSSESHNEGFCWSPDGSKIAFNSTRSGNFDIWLMELRRDKIKKELLENDP